MFVAAHCRLPRTRDGLCLEAGSLLVDSTSLPHSVLGLAVCRTGRLSPSATQASPAVPLSEKVSPREAVSPRLTAASASSPVPLDKKHRAEVQHSKTLLDDYRRRVLDAVAQPLSAGSLEGLRSILHELRGASDTVKGLGRTIAFAVLHFVEGVVAFFASAKSVVASNAVGILIALKLVFDEMAALQPGPVAWLSVTDAALQLAVMDAMRDGSGDITPADRRIRAVMALLTLTAWCASKGSHPVTVHSTIGALRDCCAAETHDMAWDLIVSKARDILSCAVDTPTSSGEGDGNAVAAAFLHDALSKALDVLGSTRRSAYMLAAESPNDDGQRSPVSVAWSGSPALTHTFSP